MFSTSRGTAWLSSPTYDGKVTDPLNVYRNSFSGSQSMMQSSKAFCTSVSVVDIATQSFGDVFYLRFVSPSRFFVST